MSLVTGVARLPVARAASTWTPRSAWCRRGPGGGGTGTAWKVFARHQEVAAPSLVLLRVKNSGFASVGEADIRRPITFTFPGREVREFTVTDCRGVAGEDIQSPRDILRSAAYTPCFDRQQTLPATLCRP